MKIDIHVHTRNIKTGDAPTRHIEPERFGEIIRETDVGIVAVTNHNHFDFDQYKKLVRSVNGICQVWPGVELDIIESGVRSHLLLIVAPKKADIFNDRLKVAMKAMSADAFSISLDDVVTTFDELEPVYVAHYYSKKPALSDEGINRLLKLVGKPSHVVKEATDALSVGIFISHGHMAIYGSDVHDWNDYKRDAPSLPDLRLPVDSFEQFKLLLAKDEPTINTVLSKKLQESITIKPFQDDSPITLTVFNDINVLFGSKGTGKSDILKSIAKFYNERGQKCRVYEASVEHVNDRFDIKGSSFAIDLGEFGIDECRSEFVLLFKVEECPVTSVSKYVSYFSDIATNARAKKIKAHDLQMEDAEGPLRKFDDINESATKIARFQNFLCEDREITSIVDKNILDRAVTALGLVYERLDEAAEGRFLQGKSAELFNSFVEFVAEAVSRKTGKPQKPTTTGFLEHARNRIKIERALKKIALNLTKEIRLSPELIGDLGEKGRIFCKTEAAFQTGSLTDSSLKPVSGIKKTTQKNLGRDLIRLSNSIYSDTFFEKLSEAFENEADYKVVSLEDFILFKRYFTIEGKPYRPSSGESSMLLLHKELSEDKDIYLLDEPEKSLGNDYINDVIVPMLKDLVRTGKKVFIATHDANIAVRTLPYNSIHRRHDVEGYRTFVGNPFSNHLRCLGDPNSKIDWKEISMKTLEGGREAFGERGKIYGNA